MDTTFNLQHFWSQGDGFGHFVTLVLLTMSVLSWGVIFMRLSMYARLRQLSKGLATFWHNKDHDTRIAALAPFDKENLLTPLAQLANVSNDTATLERKLSHAARVAHQHLDKGLTLLATVASAAAFVGLLGTVWGIYRTLITVAAQGQMDITHIIGPIGEALIMTAFGLAVALPALFAYNFFSRNNQSIQTEIDAFAHDILNLHETKAD
jgi:biopolymer transport protein ExbB